MWVGGSAKWRAEKCTDFNRFSVVLACGNHQLSLLLLCQQMGGSSALSVQWALHARHVCCAGTFSPLGGSSAWPLLVCAGKPAAIVNAVWVGSTDRAVSSVPSTSALHGFLHCWNWAKSSNVCELQATRQISLNVTSWRLRPFEWTKIKGQCLCEGLSLLVACGCGGPARVTRVSPPCSVLCDGNACGTPGCTHCCLPPCLASCCHVTAHVNEKRAQNWCCLCCFCQTGTVCADCFFLFHVFSSCCSLRGWVIIWKGRPRIWFLFTFRSQHPVLMAQMGFKMAITVTFAKGYWQYCEI